MGGGEGNWFRSLGDQACNCGLGASRQHAAVRERGCCSPLPAGRRLVQEQELVNSIQLSGEYLKKQKKIGRSMIGLSG